MNIEENRMVLKCREFINILEREQVDIVECHVDGLQHYFLIKENLMNEMQDPANAALWNLEADVFELQSLMKRIVDLTASNEKSLQETRERVAAKLFDLQNSKAAVNAYCGNK
ncbi:MAG: hypothetical protein HQL09_00715 [Nitrospirae bacterium]|nr:hypothetical protein [Nitrospirota bacterium]